MVMRKLQKKLNRLLLRITILMLTLFPTLAFVERAWIVTLIVRFLKLLIVGLISWAIYQILLTIVLLFAKDSNDCNSQRSRGLKLNDANAIVPQCMDDGRFAALQCDKNGACQCWTPDGQVISGDKSNALKICDCLLQVRHGKKTPIGAFQPTCDNGGYFAKKQCWSSTGMCWCSDKDGKRLTEPTRDQISCETDCHARRKEVTDQNDSKLFLPHCEENGTYSAMQCDADDPSVCACWTPEGVVVKEKSKDIKHCGCFIELHKGQKTPIGGFQPKCNANGFYESKQYWSSTGMSWCSDKDGKKLTEPGRGELNCDKVDKATSDSPSSTAASEVATATAQSCKTQRDEMLKKVPSEEKSLLPTCLDDGTFAPIQCDDDGKECQCVASDGTLIREKSDKTRLCDCFVQQHIGKKNKFGGFEPKCDENGYFEVKQCRPSSGMCWCSDKYGNKTMEPVRGDPKCPVQGVSNCKADRDDKLKSSQEKSSVVVPVCAEDGSYASIQCDDEGACQCTTPDGQVVKEKSDKILFCDCFLHQHRGQQNKFGGFQPKCDEKGFYEMKQCSTSSGVCWCSDKYGNKTTEKKRGDVDCPLTGTVQHSSCKERREELLKKNEKKEMVPTCLDDGTYSPMQCGEGGTPCQCSTSEGMPVDEISDKIKFCGCILHRNHAKQRRIGGFQPKCDQEGYYEVKQCSSSSGMCWCSDRHGNKITGPTRSANLTCEITTTAPIAETAASNVPEDCEKMRDEAEKDTNSEFIPKCEPDGSFSALQCNRKNECQCRSPEGTKVTVGFSAELKYCACFVDIFNAKDGVIGSFKPKCSKDGYYEKMQCSTSSGMCWCVNKYGRKLTQPQRERPQCI